ncbi:DUF523 domain-containing protein [Halobacteriovorax sp. RZ-2]|uniref:DUF523 domain-containing protein n=1 Tax=unclassified Halobacteriovorax TaxID=2639665 RepID=UPI0037126B1F
MMIVSACLAGKKCRYDGEHKKQQLISDLVAQGKAIAVCPEELGGLPTPRPPAENVDGKLITIDGEDVSVNYELGAQRSLEIALENSCTKALLKSKSPMCGAGLVYDGSFAGNLIEGDGEFTKKLKENGIQVQAID